MEAAVSLAIEREPDFFALSRARGRARTLVAEIEGRLAGCVSVARRTAWVEARRAEISYVADLKVAPTHRSVGLGTRLVQAALEEESRLGPAPLLATLAAGNRPVERLAERHGGARGLIGSVDVRCLQLFAARAPRVADFEIGRARPEDEAELVALLDGFYRERQFAPVFGGGGLREILHRSPGLTLHEHFVARRDGRILATVALWDQESLCCAWRSGPSVSRHAPSRSQARPRRDGTCVSRSCAIRPTCRERGRRYRLWFERRRATPLAPATTSPC
jgi:GNAT superfamily N-acetyltransferase